MGAGKSTVGKKIATKLGWKWIDLDKVIEDAEDKSIAELFDELGEERFRDLEQSHLKDLINKENLIVSTGGGTPCFYDNMNWMKEHGLTLYINLPPGALLKRLVNAKNKDARPLLKGKTDKELYDYIVKLLDQRESVYSGANLIIDGTKLSGKDLTNLAQQVYNEIKQI